MKKHKMLVLYSLLIAIAISAGAWLQPAWGVESGSPPQSDQSANNQQPTLKDVQKQTAEIRKAKGMMWTTTNDDRWAAAKRESDRRAHAVAKGEGGSK